MKRKSRAIAKRNIRQISGKPRQVAKNQYKWLIHGIFILLIVGLITFVVNYNESKGTVGQAYKTSKVCKSHAYIKCANGNLYWYDSCNEKEGLYAAIISCR